MTSGPGQMGGTYEVTATSIRDVALAAHPRVFRRRIHRDDDAGDTLRYPSQHCRYHQPTTPNQPGAGSAETVSPHCALSASDPGESLSDRRGARDLQGANRGYRGAH